MAKHTRKTPVDENKILRIEVLMLRNELNATGFATRIGCDRSLVSHWLLRIGEPTGARLERIAREFSVSMDWLTGQGLTPEQLDAEARQLRRVLRGGKRLADLLEHFDDEDLFRILGPHAPKPDASGDGK
jgi:transcriptional regulator with XRE-family HTH domain